MATLWLWEQRKEVSDDIFMFVRREVSFHEFIVLFKKKRKVREMEKKKGKKVKEKGEENRVKKEIREEKEKEKIKKERKNREI